MRAFDATTGKLLPAPNSDHLPLEEVTIAGNLKDIFMGLAAVGKDVDVRGAIQVGSILVTEMTIAGE